MSCCGRSRADATLSPPALPQALSRPTSPAPAVRSAAPVAFVYRGETRLNAQGPITRRVYRFEHPGAVVQVDARDAPSMAAVPNLRRA